jgi:hypothetical protein
MIQSRQLGRLERASQPWFRYELDQAYAFQPARMLTRQTIKSVLDVLQGFAGQFSLGLILDLYSHSPHLVNQQDELDLVSGHCKARRETRSSGVQRCAEAVQSELHWLALARGQNIW